MTSGTKSYTSESSGWSKTWSGEDDPIKKKRYNAYSMVGSDWYCNINRLQRYGIEYFAAAKSRAGVISFDADANLDSSALAAISESIRGHSFNAAIFAAESKESLATVTNTLRAVFTAFKAIKRRDLPSALRAIGRLPGQDSKKAHRRLEAGDIPGAWLALRYGWVPLLQDIYEAMKAYENRSNGARGVTVSERKSKKIDYGNVGRASDSVCFRAYTYFRQTIHYRVTFSENLSAARTLGLNNPAAVLWERLPFSFVVDWALPIGQYLDNLGFFSGLQLVYEKTVFSAAVDHIVQFQPLSVEYGGVDLSFPTRGEFNERRLDRTRGTVLSVPFPSHKSLEKTFSIGHIQNASALIAQMVINARK